MLYYYTAKFMFIVNVGSENLTTRLNFTAAALTNGAT